MHQELLKRIIIALYRRMCSGSLLVIVPELPWGCDSLINLLRCLELFGWQTDISPAAGIRIPQPCSGRIILSGEQVDLSVYQKIWIPALPLSVLSRLKAVGPCNRQEAMILEAVMGKIPVGAPQKSWLPPQFRDMEDDSGSLNRQVAELSGTLASWGLAWVPEEESGSWILGAGKTAGETLWQEPVLHGSAVRMLGSDTQMLRIQQGTVVTAAARDELSRRRIRLVGDR